MKTKKGKKVDGGTFLKVWKAKLKSLTGDQSRCANMKPKVTQKTWQRDVSLRTRNLSSANSNPSHQVVLPFGLEDWEIINDLKTVNRLPASVTISCALDLYMKSKGVEEGFGLFGQVQHSGKLKTGSNSDNDHGLLSEWCDMAAGIALLFEQALPFRLLYPPGQGQVAVMDGLEVYNKDKPKIELYGCRFLLRLVCQLPIIGHIYVEEDDIGKVLTAKLNDFVGFLNKNQSTLFAISKT
mmetsp:Transcript_31459/g.75918  ORF Transcript_31459/g.75918 Transcript_31459/m.75918 type:complete len:239 (-) Transcript_31459:994-1710(-)